jgi:hypothetical protein
MKACPCCSYTLLQYIQGAKLYWFCSHCCQEMPDFELRDRGSLNTIRPTRLEQLKQDGYAALRPQHRIRTATLPQDSSAA